MAIQVADNFSYKGGKPLDARSKYATLAAMKAAAEADLYNGCMAYVDAEDKYYTFNSANTVDATTGKWREFVSGGGSSDLADLGDVNLTSPTNGQVLRYDAANEKWVNDDESGGGGHEILDNGTAMAARAGLNFVDFDLSDDSTDDETEVAAHRLTSAEMNEIMGTLPGTPTELPVLFDETGAERVVGWYVTSAGKKPVYEKSYKFNIPSPNTDWSSTVTVSIIDKFLGYSAVGQRTGDSIHYTHLINGSSFTVQGDFYVLFDSTNKILYFTHRGSIGADGEVIFNVRYTKNTDTPS